MSYTIRTETPTDHSAIYNLIKIAFQTANVSDGSEQDFYTSLKNSQRFIPELALIAEQNDKIIGQVMLTRFEIKCNNGTKQPSLLLAPIAVAKDYRSQGIGFALMKEAFKRAKDLGFKSVFLMGDPAYYSRIGFHQTTNFSITCQDNDVPAIYIQALELVPNALKNCAGQISFNVLN